MKNIQIQVSFVLFLVMGAATQASAFNVQEPVETYPLRSPYPYVLSQPIDMLPQGYVMIRVGEETFYYSGGVFYQRIMRDQKYVIVPPPIGAVVFSIPIGYQEMYINGESFYEYQGIYYKRVLEGYRVIYPPV